MAAYNEDGTMSDDCLFGTCNCCTRSKPFERDVEGIIVVLRRERAELRTRLASTATQVTDLRTEVAHVTSHYLVALDRNDKAMAEIRQLNATWAEDLANEVKASRTRQAQIEGIVKAVIEDWYCGNWDPEVAIRRLENVLKESE